MNGSSEVTRGDVEKLCKSIYEETAAEYELMKARMGTSAFGFKILYGPPIVNAPILFMGYQPGGSAGSALKGETNGERQGWPNRCEYAYEDWRLAKQMRKIWSVSFLSRCVGMNAVFFRAPSEKAWKQLHGYREAEKFSLKRAQRIVHAVQPQNIVVIGIGKFDELTSGTVALFGGKGRPLIKEGMLWDRPAYGVISLSGAQISNSDMNEIRSFFERQNLN